ncbi:hypothetical protein SLEP1_g41089 [Rubroshorea leprosula]|uniref:Uncharacterized protein n=1 Tax=Rubroshorea leprosula TaxID=152421 RepID=A0AAV5L5V4_9ROSI|nr:hypothetical protein SLEP1_g41089 [Rubroshorea leprosula]
MLFRSFSATGSKLRPSVQDLALDVLPLSLALPEVERLIQDFRIPLYKGFYLIEEAIQFAQQYLGDSFFISPHLSPDLQEPSGEIVKTTLAPLAGGRQIKWYQSFFIYIWSRVLFFLFPDPLQPTSPSHRPPFSDREHRQKRGEFSFFLVLGLEVNPEIPLHSADFRICSALLCPSASSSCRWSASRFFGKGTTKNHPFSLNSSWVTLIVLWVLEF